MDLNNADGNSDPPGPSQRHPEPDDGSAGDSASWYYDLDDIAEDEDIDDDEDSDYRDEPDEDDGEDDDFQGMCGYCVMVISILSNVPLHALEALATNASLLQMHYLVM